MIDIITSFIIKEGENEETINFFGKIDDANRAIELHYELNSEVSDSFSIEIFQGKRLILRATSTDGQDFFIYGCSFSRQERHFLPSSMGTLTGRFEILIKQKSIHEKYDSISFSFEGIENVFPLVDFQIEATDYNGPIVITRPALDSKQYDVGNGISCSVVSCFSGIPFNPCSEIHVTQSKHIEVKLPERKPVLELLAELSKVKQYIEFLLSQEIQMSDIRFSSTADTIISASVIAAPILVPNTLIKVIENRHYITTEADFFNGMQSWLNGIEKYNRVIALWQKTIYNANVSDEDVFIWRCQAFELLCSLTDEVKSEAYNNLAPDQANPNLRNYLQVVSSKYDIATLFEKYFADVKDVRDKLTHNNPKKTVTETQIKNSYALINYFLVATLAKVMGFKCSLPGFILMPKN